MDFTLIELFILNDDLAVSESHSLESSGYECGAAHCGAARLL
jgi:hypothetical protein